MTKAEMLWIATRMHYKGYSVDYLRTTKISEPHTIVS